jgi:hypothetical protein
LDELKRTQLSEHVTPELREYLLDSIEHHIERKLAARQLLETHP